MAQQRRDEHIAKLEKLLDVAGTVTPWERIAASLRRVPVEVLIALTYRIERAMATEREMGQRAGEPTDNYDNL